ncbi:MAG: insulinase family protein [Ruminococcaceae bacterium]|nr:insulinase family protein [Oscillospiraceae bacterium]
MNMTYKEILPGIKLRVIESTRFETNCISVSFMAGISDEVASNMTLLPRVLRRGTTKHPDMKSLAAALDDMYGTRIEPISRKYGDIMTSGFICDFVDVDGDALKNTVKLLGEILFDPMLCDGVFSEDYVSGERVNLIDEIKSEINSKMSYAFKKINEHMFKDSPFGVDELGTEEEAEKISAKSLYRFYRKFVSEAPCEIFFCGKYSFDKVAYEVSKMFAGCQRGKIAKLAATTPEFAREKRICEKMDVSQACLVIGMSADVSDIYPAKLVTSIIGGGTTSKLFTNVREKESLCYSTGATFHSFEKAMFMYAGIDPSNADIAEKAVMREFENCVHGNITDEEISDSKKGMIDDLLTTEDSIFSMEAFWLRASLLNDERTPSEAAAAVKNIKREIIEKTVNDFRLSTVYLLTGTEVEKVERKLLSEH